MPPSHNGLLHGLQVLVIEDDYLQADEICLCVTDAGGIILGPAGNLEQAAELIAVSGVDVAVLDINLGDGPSFEVAGHLLQANLPFLFVTGYDCWKLPQGFEHILCLEKPFSNGHLLRSLASIAPNKRPN